MPAGSLHAAEALLPGGIAADVRIAWDEGGWIVGAEPGAAPRAGEQRTAFLLPGLASLHSHAFQRAMAGLSERRGPPEVRLADGGSDSFWTWRQVMYRFVGRMNPEAAEAVAAFLYAEMLEQGFTAVAEFHYLHHQADGTPYAAPAAMALAHVTAARAAGIGITMLPVLYRYGGIFGHPANPGQKPFLCDRELYFRIIEGVQDALAHDADAAWGYAPHSLRACSPSDLAALAEAARTMGRPVHIHAAEQRREVEECVAATGLRPVRWLLEHAGVDASWCLIHATHVDAAELRDLAASGAVAGLCPITEANLGDGIFPLPPFLAGQGVFGVGTDSNLGASPRAELRALEYSQRLAGQQRAVVASDAVPSVGVSLVQGAVRGGAQACGRKLGGLAVGQRADLVALDPDHPSLVGRRGEAVVDSWVFAGDSNPVDAVWVGGRQVVAGGRHAKREELGRAFARTMRVLAA